MRVSDQVVISNRTISVPVCNGDENNLASCLSISSSPWCQYLLVDCRNPVPQPLPPVTIPSDPTGTVVPDTTSTGDTIMRETLVITESSTAQPEPSGRVRVDSEEGGVPIAVIAGVGGVLVVLIALALLVLLVCFILLKKNHTKEEEVVKFER